MSTYEFDLDESGAPQVVVAALGGELDLTNAREVEERLSAVAPDAFLAVDVNRIVFIDSAMLHVLFKLARQREQRMALLMEEGAAVARTIDIVGLRHAVRIVASIDQLGLGSPA